MIGFLGKRLLLAVPTIVLVTFFVFVLMALSPTDPAVTLAGDSATPQRIAQLRQMLGLDKPFLIQYLDWGGQAVRGNLGTSPITHQSVTSELLFRLPVTASLVLLALIFALAISLTLGTVAALHKGGAVDWIANSFANLLMAIPPFIAAVLLVLFLAIDHRIFPATGYASISAGPGQWLRFTTLPALSVAIIPAALLTRQVRGALVDALEEDYIRTARAKGLRRVMVVGKHAAKNAAVPLVTVLGLVIVQTLGATVIVEEIFAIPGLGTLAVNSVLTGDLVTLQGLVLLIAVVVTVVNLLVDVSDGYFNPRLRKR